MALAHIDKYGIHIPTYPEIIARRKEEFRGIFGADVYLEPDSQEGQMLAMFAMAEFDAYQLAQSVYNSFSPQTAKGESLSRMVPLNGIARHKSGYSTVDVTVTGQAGTVITNGMAKDVAEQTWLLPSIVTIPIAGEITVTATAQKVGAVQATAGEVNIIATPTRGWQLVTNSQAATPGVDVEKDGVLRSRQRVSTALPSQTVLDGIVGAVANLDGVTRFKGYENDTGADDANGQPAHSIAIVVEGGDTQQIGQAVADKKTPGVPTTGTTTTPVTDKYGMPLVIRFYRPTEVEIDVAVTITPRAGYVSPTGEAITTNLTAYFNSLDIGEDVLLSKLYTPVNDAEPTPGQRTFDVTSLTIARHGDAKSGANLPISFTELAMGVAANSIVIVDEV
jgi:uncharacterized phage protein gp47/JayE